MFRHRIFQSQFPEISEARKGPQLPEELGDLSYDSSHDTAREWHREETCYGAIGGRYFESKPLDSFAHASLQVLATRSPLIFQTKPSFLFFFLAVFVTKSIKSELIINQSSSTRC
jgi:hypothetical protein